VCVWSRAGVSRCYVCASLTCWCDKCRCLTSCELSCNKLRAVVYSHLHTCTRILAHVKLSNNYSTQLLYSHLALTTTAPHLALTTTAPHLASPQVNLSNNLPTELCVRERYSQLGNLCLLRNKLQPVPGCNELQVVMVSNKVLSLGNSQVKRSNKVLSLGNSQVKRRCKEVVCLGK